MKKAPRIIKHGTPTGYFSSGCRCRTCRYAGSRYMRNYYRDKRNRALEQQAA